MIASEIEQKITPDFANFSLYVVPIEILSKTASTATFDNFFCSSNEIPNFSNVFKIFFFVTIILLGNLNIFYFYLDNTDQLIRK